MHAQFLNENRVQMQMPFIISLLSGIKAISICTNCLRQLSKLSADRAYTAINMDSTTLQGVTIFGCAIYVQLQHDFVSLFLSIFHSLSPCGELRVSVCVLT